MCPEIYASDFKLGCFALEDMGDETLLKKLIFVNNDSDELSWYKMAVEQLLGIHAVDGSKYNCSMFQRAFDQNKLMKEVRFTLSHLVLI